MTALAHVPGGHPRESRGESLLSRPVPSRPVRGDTFRLDPHLDPEYRRDITKKGDQQVTDAREMTPEYVQIRSDFQRWIIDNDGPQGLRRLDMPRLTTLIEQCVANGRPNSTLLWRLLTPDGTDVALINRRLRELIP